MEEDGFDMCLCQGGVFLGVFFYSFGLRLRFFCRKRWVHLGLRDPHLRIWKVNGRTLAASCQKRRDATNIYQLAVH